MSGEENKGRTPKKIEFAPRERIRFTEEIAELVLRLIRHPDALVSDESMLSDFAWLDSDHAEGPGSKPGYYVFKYTRAKKGFNPLYDDHNDPNNWVEVTEEVKAIPFKRLTIRKILRHTGVDITPVYNKCLPEVFQYIAEHMPDDKREKFFRKKR